LPAITSHLEIKRNALIAIKNCFETIMLTGDGKTGQCQAVLSMYVCEMILDAIGCFARRYSVTAGTQLREGAGIGNIVGALTSAGSGVADSLRERYGASTIWRTLFVEKRLTQAICLSAFSGDWISNFENLLNTALTVPVNSTSFIAPAERRFVAADFTSKAATWMYRIGVGFVAGSDLDSLSLYLICSDEPAKCSDIEDFKNGRCDCEGKGKKEKMIKGWGRITRGTVIGEGGQGEEIIYQHPDKIRYDRAELRWTYKNAQGETVTASSGEIPIRLVGSPAPAYCEFDDSELEFRCNIGLGVPDDTIRFVSIKPSKDVYNIGDYLTLDYEISQRVPKDAEELCAGSLNCKYTKYLNIVIRDATTKAIIYPEEGTVYRIPLPVGTEMHRLSEPSDFQITEERLTRGRATLGDKKVIYGTIDVDLSVPNPNAPATDIAIKFTKSGKQINYVQCTFSKGKTFDQVASENDLSCDQATAPVETLPATINVGDLSIKVKSMTSDSAILLVRITSIKMECKDEVALEAVSTLTESVLRQKPGVAQYTATDQIVYYGDKPQEKVTPIRVRCQPTIAPAEYEILPSIENNNKIKIKINKATRDVYSVKLFVDGIDFGKKEERETKINIPGEVSIDITNANKLEKNKEYTLSVQLFGKNDEFLFKDETYKIKKDGTWKLYQTKEGKETEVK